MQGCVDSLQGSFIRRYCSCIKHMSRYCRMCTPTYVKCRALLSGCRVLLTDHRARLSECSVLPSNMCLAIATHMCTPTKCRTLLSGYEVLLTDDRARLSGGIALPSYLCLAIATHIYTPAHKYPHVHRQK